MSSFYLRILLKLTINIQFEHCLHFGTFHSIVGKY